MVAMDLDTLILEIPKAISPCFEGDYYSIIHTEKGDIYSIYKVEELVNYYCMIYGSDLQGRLRATRKMLGIKKYAPVLVSPLVVGVQLPTMCLRGKIWIFSMDFKVKSRGKKECIVRLSENLEFRVRMSKRSLRQKQSQAMEVFVKFTQNTKKYE